MADVVFIGGFNAAPTRVGHLELPLNEEVWTIGRVSIPLKLEHRLIVIASNAGRYVACVKFHRATLAFNIPAPTPKDVGNDLFPL